MGPEVHRRSQGGRKSRSSGTWPTRRSIFRCRCRRRTSTATAASTWSAGTSCARSGTDGKSKWDSSIRSGRSPPRPPDVPAWDTRTDASKGPLRPHHGDLRGDDRPPGPQHRQRSSPASRSAASSTTRSSVPVPTTAATPRAARAAGWKASEPGGPQSTVFLGQSWATLANTPFRRYKHFTHEGGISTPLIAHWPAGIPSERNGKLEKQPGHLIDVMATVVAGHGAPSTRRNSTATRFSRWKA